MTKTNQRLLAVFGALALVTVFAVATTNEAPGTEPTETATETAPAVPLLDNPDEWERCTTKAKRMKPIVCIGSYETCAQEHQHLGAWEALRCLRDAQEREVARLQRANR